MKEEHFVGRSAAVKRLGDVLTGRERAEGMVTIQSIEGPGGVGKTCLFNYAFRSVDLSQRNYLTLRVDGNDPAARSLVRAIPHMVDSAVAEAIRERPPGYYFPRVRRVIKAIETLRNQAIAEFQRLHPDDEEERSALVQYLDYAMKCGKAVNDVFPISRDCFSVQELERHRPLIEAIPSMVSLLQEGRSALERVGLFSESRALRNAIKENAARPFADALVSDLSAILARYRTQDRLRASHGKVKEIDRLLLILDDYEMLQEPLGEFLVGYLLPSLRRANFESVLVILGRDQLRATHPAWEQNLEANLLKPIVLEPLSRQEMDRLVASYGVKTQAEKDRAWRETQGYPFYVELWIEEMESGGRSAVMLKRVYDRTTRWMSDKQKDWLHQTLFLDEVNVRTLRGMVSSDQEAKEAFRWFESEGSVRDTVGGFFRVREYLRSRLIDYLRISDPDTFEYLKRQGQLAISDQA